MTASRPLLRSESVVAKIVDSVGEEERDSCHHNRLKRTDGSLSPMASAEHLLHEAQYAFQSISFGESRDNTRNASRAKALCNKIIRKFPTSMEAAEAHAILRRLGEEAYSSEMTTRHRHVPQSTHHQTPSQGRETRNMLTSDGGVETLDWSGLISWLLAMPKSILAIYVIAGIFLFGIFGSFLLVPLIAFVLITGRFRQMLKPEQRRELNKFVARANAYIASQRD